MRGRVRIAALIATLSIVGVSTGRAENDDVVMTLAECLAEATATSERLHSTRFRHEAAQAHSNSAAARRWPTLTGLAAYDYASEVAVIDIPAGPTPRSIEFGDGNTYRFALGVDVPLYTGGTLSANLRAEQAEVRATGLDVSADSLGIVHDVRGFFYRALASRSQLDAARVSVRRLERHLSRLNGRIAVGMGTEEERVQTTARLRQAEQRVLAAELQVAVDELALGRSVGHPGERISPGGNLDIPLFTGELPPAATFESRPELAALDARRNEGDLRARAAFGALLPAVIASAQMNYGRPGVDPIQNEWMPWASARVSLAWTLFDRGARNQNVSAARATARVVEAHRNDLFKAFEGAFETAKVRLDYTRRQSAKAVERLEAERRRIELVAGRHEEGMATEIELLDAHDDLVEAEAAEVAARVAVRLAESDLLYATGQ